MIERENFRFYFPLATCILLSLLLTEPNAAFTSTPFGVRPDAKLPPTLVTMTTEGNGSPSTFREAEVLGLKLMQEQKYEEALQGMFVYQSTCVSYCLYVACLLVIPTFLKQVILYLTPLYPKSLLMVNSGAALAVILALLQIGTFLFQQTAMQVSVTLQIDWKTILIGAVYEKSLKLSQKSMQTFTSGQILNIINVDIEKVSLAFVQASQLLTAPIQLIVSIILLGDLIGYAVWAGAGSLLGILAFQVFLIGFLVIVQKKFLAQGDKRLKSLREVLYGIKIIKFRSLENFFYDRIQKIRDQQMAYLSKYYLVQTFFVGFIQIAPISMPSNNS